MRESSTPAWVLNNVQLSDAPACLDTCVLVRSIYASGLVHHVSLSNLAGEYASIESTDEIIYALVNKH